MNKIFVSLLFFITALIQSQELKVQPLAPPESKDHSDLAFLKQNLEGKRIVMLGEMTHMYGNIFEMKARVVEYLHKELGYTTIALEASMYDVWLMHSQNPEFNPAVFKKTAVVWSEAHEFTRLVNYIEENDLKVVGFDSQVFQHTIEFIDDFFAFCSKNNIKLKLDEDDLGIIMEDVLDAVQYEEDDIPFKNYKKEIEGVIRKMEKLPATEENFHWLQFTKSLLACSKDAYYNTTEVRTSDLVNSNHNFRDEQMADNLIAYLNRNKEEKVVVWADNIHIIKDISSYTQPVINEFRSMGSYVLNSFPEEVYSLATMHANDSLFDGKKWNSTPVLSRSFEHTLVSMNEPFLFIDSNQGEMKKPQTSRLLSFVDFYEGRLDQLFDGYIFLKHATLPTKLKSNTAIPIDEEHPISEDRENNYKTEKFNGKLVDAVTGAPVPFANIMLLEKGSYRLTDENGSYTLSLPVGTDSQVIVSISSMGYEEEKIPLNKLQKITKMTPAFESLSEVVITGYKTTPKKVLQKAIKKIEENYLLEPFNFERYGHFVGYRNDESSIDIEFVTKNYLEGYRHNYPVNQKVEQVKWNKKGATKYAHHLTGFREDAMQYANILHKRKFKKFEIEFIFSDDPRNKDLYIIKFLNKRDRFGYTNRWYPTTYSGEIYINKEDYGVVKVVQNWQSTILEDKAEKYKFWLGLFKDTLSIKDVIISEYEKHPDGKYYASRYFMRYYSEKTDLKGEFVNTTREGVSFLDKYSQDVLEIFMYDNRLKDSALDRVPFDENFWSTYELSKSL